MANSNASTRGKNRENVEEKELIAAIASGDEQAFNQFIRHYQSFILNVCHRLLPDRADAEDIAQDVCCAVYEHASGFRGNCKLTTWLYRLALNRAMNLRRKRKWMSYLSVFGSEAGVRSGSAIDIASSPDTQPDHILEKRELIENLYRVLDELPEKQRAVLILQKFDELTGQEIAEIMELSLTAVQALLFRARTNLQKRMLNLFEKK